MIQNKYSSRNAGHVCGIWALLVATLFLALQKASAQENSSEASPSILTVAILPFETEDGEKDVASTLLTVHLSTDENLLLVEREELDKILAEESLSLSGLVRSDQAVQVGHLTGARILITGSIFETGTKRYLVAKMMSTETGRVLGDTASGDTNVAIDKLAEELSVKIRKTLKEKADRLVAKPETRDDLLAKMKTIVKDHSKSDLLPKVYVSIAEQHINQAAKDPAAETEISWYLNSLGFQVVESKDAADLLVEGEGFSEFAARHGDLVSVKSRLEVKVINRSNKNQLAAERQTGVAVDLSENIAAKNSLQDSGAKIMLRILPDIAKWEPE